MGISSYEQLIIKKLLHYIDGEFVLCKKVTCKFSSNMPPPKGKKPQMIKIVLSQILFDLRVGVIVDFG